MIETATAIVRNYILEHKPGINPVLFTVWQAKVLQNFKCLISSPLGMYFELTYDGDRQCWYLDAYRKTDNREISDAVLK
jgi:hypothetical protein